MIFKNLLLIYHLPWGNKSTEIIKRWFRNNSYASSNLIIDDNLENKFPTLEGIHLEYFDIKTCTVVINPYARGLIKYEWAKINKSIIHSDINLESFEVFLDSLFSLKKINSNLIFKSQTELVEYQKNNKRYKTTFVLKRENLIEDFKKVQKFVKSHVPLIIRPTEENFIYQEKYNKTCIEIVNELYKDDLRNFNYSF